MKLNFTKDDLILFIYNELSAEKSSAIQEALTTDLELKQSYDELLKLKAKLSAIEAEPDPSTIDIILELSDSYSSLETH